MRKFIMCATLLIISATAFCQDTQPATALTREEYLKKSKTQKTLGFVFLGVGAATLIAVSGGNTDFSILGTLVVIGGIATLASIPLFIASGRNKRRANNTSVSFKFERPDTKAAFAGVRALPAISFKLNL